MADLIAMEIFLGVVGQYFMCKADNLMDAIKYYGRGCGNES